jgi:hypothetical protein
MARRISGLYSKRMIKGAVMRNRKRFLGIILGALGFLFVSACSSDKGGISEETWSGQMSAFNVNEHQLHKTVCDPWGGNPPPQFDKGVEASLYYLTKNVTEDTPLYEYFQRGHHSEQTLFFSQINVPTRKFTEGFATEAGESVNDDNGDRLIEFFAMRFETKLKLNPDQELGEYEIALLSDDGAEVRIKDGDNIQTLISHPNKTPTKMMCSTTKINFTEEGKAYPLEIDYFQGPRYHIALVLMMRKVTGNAGEDPLCGSSGNELFFDYNNNSKPLSAYKKLLKRGWAPAVAQNFDLPEKYTYNPCTAGEAPKIINFTMTRLSDTQATFTWETDIAATSQVMVTDSETGETLVTTSDNILRTTHQVTVTGLSSGTSYEARGISISENLGKAISAPLEFTTLIF